jgi:hypothetical protein
LAGAGNTLHPGPGPIGPGPGPCAALKLLASAVCTDGAAGCGLSWACAIFFVDDVACPNEGVLFVAVAPELLEAGVCANMAAPHSVPNAIT